MMSDNSLRADITTVVGSTAAVLRVGVLMLAVFVLAALQSFPAVAQGVAWLDASHTKVIYPKTGDGSNGVEPVVARRQELVKFDSRPKTKPRGADDKRRVFADRRAARFSRVAARSTPQIVEAVARAARRFSVDPYLVQAVIHAESVYRPDARSPKDAIGLMQVLPGTAMDMGLQAHPSATVEELLTDPRVSIVVGTKYLAEQLRRFDGDVTLAVAAYNAGPGAVLKAGNKVPPYPETQQYVESVQDLTQRYRALQTFKEVM